VKHSVFSGRQCGAGQCGAGQCGAGQCVTVGTQRGAGQSVTVVENSVMSNAVATIPQLATLSQCQSYPSAQVPTLQSQSYPFVLYCVNVTVPRHC
jgi:hypothetical protein